MALRPCIADGCTELANGTRCEQHRLATQRAKDLRRGTRTWYRGDWEKIRKAALLRCPYCVACGATTDLTVDHVRARSTADGVQVLCRPCNSAKGAR